jgi:hypothetical protein
MTEIIGEEKRKPQRLYTSIRTNRSVDSDSTHVCGRPREIEDRKYGMYVSLSHYYHHH